MHYLSKMKNLNAIRVIINIKMVEAWANNNVITHAAGYAIRNIKKVNIKDLFHREPHIRLRSGCMFIY